MIGHDDNEASDGLLRTRERPRKLLLAAGIILVVIAGGGTALAASAKPSGTTSSVISAAAASPDYWTGATLGVRCEASTTQTSGWT